MILLLISKALWRKRKPRAKPFLIAGRLALKLEEMAGWMSKTTTASGAGENPSGVLVLFPMLGRNFLQFRRSQIEVIRIVRPGALHSSVNFHVEKNHKTEGWLCPRHHCTLRGYAGAG
ncbi:MAG: hypothetical protein WA690_06310 [Candidatus Acidiferrales bacterium]